MAWMGKLSSFTVEGSEGRASRAGEHSAGGALHGAFLLPTRSERLPARRSRLPARTHLSAAPAGAPACGWRRRTCGRGPRCIGRASPRVPEASPARWAPKPCHWLSCPRTRQSGPARHPARSAIPGGGGEAWVSRPPWLPSGLLCGRHPSLPHSPLQVAECAGLRGQIKGPGAGAPYEEHQGPLRAVSPRSCLCPVLRTLPSSGAQWGESLRHPGKGRAGPGLRCYTSLAPALGAQAEPDVLGWGHLALN